MNQENEIDHGTNQAILQLPRHRYHSQIPDLHGWSPKYATMGMRRMEHVKKNTKKSSELSPHLYKVNTKN